MSGGRRAPLERDIFTAEIWRDPATVAGCRRLPVGALSLLSRSILEEEKRQ
jgi:hypothetical protein